MKPPVLIALLTAISLSLSGMAVAQGRDGGRRPEHWPGPHQRPVHPGQHGMPQPGMHQPPGGAGPQNPNAQGRGAGPDQNFYRGGRLPREYRNNQYVVNDWRGHHLSPPPRGHHWVQVGADYVLVAIATGLIVQVLLNQ